jgi:ATP-dependent RNA helicase DeaD
VATDIAARGLDVDDLTHVIHYDLPTEANVYTHRSGRTGRMGKAGTSLALISDNERTRLRWIERIVKRKFSEMKVPGKREICKQQLMQLVERAFSVDVDKEQIATYLPIIEEKLSSLTREEIIERFVSLEFNKFLKYYKNLKDLKPVTKPVRRSEPARRGKPIKRTLHKKENGYDWLAVDLGKNNKVLPLDIIGLVNQSTNSGSIRLGRIDIGLSRSWFQVESESLAVVEKALRNATYKRRQIKVERVSSSPGRAQKTA